MSSTSQTNDQPVSVTNRDDVSVKKNSRMRIFLFLLPLLFLIAWFFFYLHTGRYVSTENAYVKSNIIAVSSDVSGRVTEVLITDNQLVNKGDVLFRIDAETLELEVMQAKAQKAVAIAEIEELRAEYNEARVSVDEATARVAFFRQEFQRQKKIKSQGIGGGQEHDEALFELRAAQQRVVVLNERIVKSLATFNGDPELPVEEHPLYMQADVAYEMARSQIGKTAVAAPADGIVSNVQLQAGEFLQAGTPAFTLIESGQVWIEANLKETQLTHVTEGQSASLKVDAYPGVEWQAIVSSIAPATGAEFTLLPPQNATGNWVKVVQRVPVNLQVHTPEDAPVLRAGMTVTVKIDTEREHEVLTFLRNLQLTDASADPVELNGPDDFQAVQIYEQDTVGETKSLVTEAVSENDNATVAAIARLDPENYTVEVLRTDDMSMLGQLMSDLPLDTAVMVYRLASGSDGEGRFGLAAGVFDSRELADALSTKLSRNVQQRNPATDPKTRRVGDIQRQLIVD